MSGLSGPPFNGEPRGYCCTPTKRPAISLRSLGNIRSTATSEPPPRCLERTFRDFRRMPVHRHRQVRPHGGPRPGTAQLRATSSLGTPTIAGAAAFAANRTRAPTFARRA